MQSFNYDWKALVLLQALCQRAAASLFKTGGTASYWTQSTPTAWAPGSGPTTPSFLALPPTPRAICSAHLVSWALFSSLRDTCRCSQVLHLCKESDTNTFVQFMCCPLCHHTESWSLTSDECVSFNKVQHGQTLKERFENGQSGVSWISQVISNMLDFGLEPQTALDAPRFSLYGVDSAEGPSTVLESMCATAGT